MQALVPGRAVKGARGGRCYMYVTNAIRYKHISILHLGHTKLFVLGQDQQVCHNKWFIEWFACHV